MTEDEEDIDIEALNKAMEMFKSTEGFHVDLESIDGFINIDGIVYRIIKGKIIYD